MRWIKTGAVMSAVCGLLLATAACLEGPPMHSLRLKTPGIALAVWWAVFVLMLAAPKAVIADSRVRTAETSRGVSDVCAEQYHPVLVVQPLGTHLAIADQRAPTSHVTSGLQPEALAPAELQVPAVLLRTLLREEGISRSIELHVPAALLATLAAEGGVQRPQRSHDLCTPFFSLY